MKRTYKTPKDFPILMRVGAMLEKGLITEREAGKVIVEDDEAVEMFYAVLAKELKRQYGKCAK